MGCVSISKNCNQEAFKGIIIHNHIVLKLIINLSLYYFSFAIRRNYECLLLRRIYFICRIIDHKKSRNSKLIFHFSLHASKIKQKLMFAD